MVGRRSLVWAAWAGIALGLLSPDCYSQRHHSSYRSHSYSHSTHIATGRHKSTYATGAARDSHGKIKRSSEARHEFMKETGYPHGRKGYVIDHVVPLSKGGSDSPSNMQWQTKEEAKQKDKWERGQTHTKRRKHK